VAAVIVNYRSTASTLGCIASLRQAGGVDDIVVVDSASGDDCATKVREANVVFVPMSENLGYGAAANRGVRATDDPLVVISNPDIVVTPGTVAALAAAMEADPRLGAVGPRIDRVDGTRYPSARTFPSIVDAAGHGFVGLVTTRNRWSDRYLRADQEDPGPVDWISGAFMMVRREAFDAVAGFDETYFMFMEDVDLCRRLHLAGWDVAYEPAGRVTHIEGVSRASAPYRMILAHHRSLLRYAWRSGKPRDRALLPLVAVGLAVRALVMAGRTALRR
jgi:N-acetylglucosaminyl-diphospho-decaprenol L-rhamnosyltransferase